MIPILEQPVNQLSDQTAPDNSSLDNPGYHKQLVQGQLEPPNVGLQATRPIKQNSVGKRVELRRSKRFRTPVLRLEIHK